MATFPAWHKRPSWPYLASFTGPPGLILSLALLKILLALAPDFSMGEPEARAQGYRGSWSSFPFSSGAVGPLPKELSSPLLGV